MARHWVIDMALIWHCFVIVMSLFFALLIFVDVRFLPVLKLCQLAQGPLLKLPFTKQKKSCLGVMGGKNNSSTEELLCQILILKLH